MKILNLSFDSAEQNLAFEDWYFHNFTEETLRIWRNPKSVVVGKHQNALAEVDLNYCIENNIPVIRRISGGGTVYHDLGNINFSFFRFTEKEKMIDYVKNLDIVREALTGLGFDVHMSERHDLFCGESKISGNAQHVKRGKALHHGTLLYDADLAALSKGIKRQKGEFIDKGVKSVRSPTLNLRDNVNLGLTLEFMRALEGQLNLEPLNNFEFSQAEIAKLNLAKYSQDTWNYGYSPSYEFKNQYLDWNLKINTERGGNISSIEIFKNNEKQKNLEGFLLNKPHFYGGILNLLIASEFESESQELMKLLF